MLDGYLRDSELLESIFEVHALVLLREVDDVGGFVERLGQVPD